MRIGPCSPECVIRHAVVAEVAHKVHVVRSGDHDGMEQVKDTAKVALVLELDEGEISHLQYRRNLGRARLRSSGIFGKTNVP